MCLQVMLLADRPLPTPPDGATFPGLAIYPIEGQTIEGVRRVSPAKFVYGVSAGNYCGCYFNYVSEEQHARHMADRAANPDAENAFTAEQAESMHRDQVNGVNSFGRYLAAHPDAELAVYNVWENCAGQNEPTRAQVPPSYFGGQAFDRLPEDLLLTIVPETPEGEPRPWEPSAPRTHDWLAGECCDLPAEGDPEETE